MKTNTLYRFFDANGDLLYVGITNSPPRRFQQHKTDKDWWHEVASITLAEYPTRTDLMNAEREAVKSESPRYNKMLQANGSQTASTPSQSITLSHGSFVALGLTNGKCPIGVVICADDTWVTLGLKEFFLGYYDQERRSYRLDDIQEIVHAFKGRDGLVDDENLARFQSRWIKEHEETR